MDRLRALEVFVAVAELGSFAAAADQLGMSRNMASRHVADLEAHLGARLLNRTTRSVSLSSIGASYLETARDVLVRLEEADRAAACNGWPRMGGYLFQHRCRSACATSPPTCTHSPAQIRR
jgi:DNA-binding transcriptional LysR family regulator